jgi:hypothetical protein
MGQEQAQGPILRAAPPAITVTGSGTASARPDRAEVTAGVVTQSATAAQALTQNSATMEKVRKAVQALGIADADVQTTDISVTPQRRPQQRPEAPPPEIVGYEVQNQIRVKVKDLATLGRLLDELVNQGANAVGRVRFSVADPAAVLDEARRKAVADARRKADLYAAATGVGVGRVLSIQEASAGFPQFAEARFSVAATSAVPVAPGEQEFQASVTVSYAIK